MSKITIDESVCKGCGLCANASRPHDTLCAVSLLVKRTAL